MRMSYPAQPPDLVETFAQELTVPSVALVEIVADLMRVTIRIHAEREPVADVLVIGCTNDVYSGSKWKLLKVLVAIDRARQKVLAKLLTRQLHAARDEEVNKRVDVRV